MAIEIPCLQYSDLKVIVPSEPSRDDLVIAIQHALEVNHVCYTRSFGSDCPGRCAIPRFAQGNLEEIRKALEEASK